MKYVYEWLPGQSVPTDVLEECSNLYSSEYGFWSNYSSTKPGERIKLSANQLGKWLYIDGASLSQARIDGKLIGYAIAIQKEVKKYGKISWITQFVVHAQHRNKSVGKRLLYSVWGFSNHFAWGLLSANPYAIRALEKTTRRRCTPVRIMKNYKKLYNFGTKNIWYMNDNLDIQVNKNESKINTTFYVDHSHLKKMISTVVSADAPWILGMLDEGWEWFAFTFNDQEKLKLTHEEIESMLDASDQITAQAYSRMELDANHTWMNYTIKEVELIVDFCKLNCGQTVLDIGCGNGRHSIELASKGYVVTSNDYINHQGIAQDRRIEFIQADCRTLNLMKKYDAVICLYDVIGSYTNEEDNKLILKTIANHLNDGSFALISVMNYEYTKHNAKRIFSIKDSPNELLELEPSNTMQSTGDVFDPLYYLLDDTTGVVYRKEQFDRGSELPAELIVRDKRFTKDEIENICENAGLKVVWSRYVRAGKWYKETTATNAKEILLLCQKTLNPYDALLDL